MADDNREIDRKLENAVPIAQLTPDTSRSSTVNGVITIVWPYNSVKNSVAFVLAEPEFRLRRARGQVRVNFVGSSAKAISESGLGSGDTVQLNLDSAEFVPNDARARIPGTEIDWQLNFSERILLQVKIAGAGETKNIDVDHPKLPEAAPRNKTPPPPAAEDEIDLLELPLLRSLSSVTPIKNSSLKRLKDGEFESPAFVKRARISYGSLFEDDIFEDEDIDHKKKSRKSTRFSLNPGSWRYGSRSPSPMRSDVEDDAEKGDDVKSSPAPRPLMTDSECQTMELDFPEPHPSVSILNQSIHSLGPQQPDPLLHPIGFMDQGHQTFPIGSWAAPLPESQQHFSDPGLFAGVPAAAPFDTAANAGLGNAAEQQEWSSQPLPAQPVSYPEFPLEGSLNPFAPGIGESAKLSSTNEISGKLDASQDEDKSFAHSNAYEVMDRGAETTSNISEHSETNHDHTTHSTSIYPDLEEEELDRHSPVQVVPVNEPFMDTNTPLAKETVTAPANPFAREAAAPSERAAMNAGTSSWAAVNRRTASRSLSRPSSSRLGSGDGQTPHSAMVIGESDSEDEDNVPLEDAAEAGLGDAPVSLPERAERTLSQAAHNPFIEGPPAGHDVTEEDWEEEVHAYADHSPDRYDDEYDQDDDGGDYNTSTYLAPQDDEDDANDVDLQQRRLQPELYDGEEESWDEDEAGDDNAGDYDELDEEAEESFDEDDEVESEIEEPPQQPQRQYMRPASSAPVFIDLLSDSEDDDEPSPGPLPSMVSSAIPASRPSMIQSQAVANSPDYGPDSEAENEEDVAGSGPGSELASESDDAESESLHVQAPVEDEISDDEKSEAQDSEDDISDNVTYEKQADQAAPGELVTTTDRQQSQEPRNLQTGDKPAISQPKFSSSGITSKDDNKAEVDKEMEDAQEQEEPASEVEPRLQQLASIASAEGEQSAQSDLAENSISTDPGPTPMTESFPAERKFDMQTKEVPAEADLPSEVVVPSSSPLASPSQYQLPAEQEDIVMEETTIVDGPQTQDLRATVSPGPQVTEPMVMDTDSVEETTSRKSYSKSPISISKNTEVVQPPTLKEATVITEEVLLVERTENSQSALEPHSAQRIDEVAQDFDTTMTVSGLTFQSQVGGSDALSQSLNPFFVESQEGEGDDMSDASSFVSQLHGDDALQAALREEESRYFDLDIQESAVPRDTSPQLQDDETSVQDQPVSRHLSPLSGQEAALVASSPVRDRDQNDSALTSSEEREDAPVTTPLMENGRQGPREPPATQPEDSDTHVSSPGPGTVPAGHVNEAGIAMGSPDWTAKERHELEEADIQASSSAKRTTPVTHKNKAGITVGSPERTAMERHQHDEAHISKSSSSVEPTPLKDETHSDIPTRAVVEKHQQELRAQADKSSLPAESTPVRSKGHFDMVMGSPEKTAKRRSGSKEVHDSSVSDPSIRLARAAIASKNASRPQDATPDISRPQTRSRNVQKSPTPDVGDDSVQLAKASLNTPSKVMHADAQLLASSPASSKMEEEASTLTASKLKLVRHLRDELSECTTLKVLRQHTGKSVEAMAVAMMTPSEPQRAKGGPREYMMSFTITDHSISPSGVAEVQLYRPHKESLPKVKTGDVVLLRNFTVVSLKGKGYGLRTNDGSSWAIFEKEDEPAQIKGPPVEYGDAETTFAAYLRGWYGLLDEKAKQKLEKVNQKIIEAGRGK